MLWKMCEKRWKLLFTPTTRESLFSPTVDHFPFILSSNRWAEKFGKVFTVNKEYNFQILHMCWDSPLKRSSKYLCSVVRLVSLNETRWKTENWEYSLMREKFSQRAENCFGEKSLKILWEKYSTCVVKIFPLSGLEVKISKTVKIEGKKNSIFWEFSLRYFK